MNAPLDRLCGLPRMGVVLQVAAILWYSRATFYGLDEVHWDALDPITKHDYVERAIRNLEELEPRCESRSPDGDGQYGLGLQRGREGGQEAEPAKHNALNHRAGSEPADSHQLKPAAVTSPDMRAAAGMGDPHARTSIRPHAAVSSRSVQSAEQSEAGSEPASSQPLPAAVTTPSTGEHAGPRRCVVEDGVTGPVNPLFDLAAGLARSESRVLVFRGLDDSQGRD